VCEKTANRQTIDALPAPFTAAIVRAEVRYELREIPSVSAERVRRHVALLLEMEEKLFYLRLFSRRR
jgi:hypothetical protein